MVDRQTTHRHTDTDTYTVCGLSVNCAAVTI